MWSVTITKRSMFGSGDRSAVTQIGRCPFFGRSFPRNPRIAPCAPCGGRITATHRERVSARSCLRQTQAVGAWERVGARGLLARDGPVLPECGRPFRESWPEPLDAPGRRIVCGTCDAAGADYNTSGDTTFVEFEVDLEKRGILLPTSREPAGDVRGTPAHGRPSPVTRFG